ncbi:MAG: DeoR/GlpR transcriptional regulator, partial [Proteobacteria bacterium]|nr:DeoR/GlpR transcriptional regulator [Pseudomonadota bacterium]
DWAFQGADGIGDDGTIYNTDLRLARVDKLMRRIAQKFCLLADHTKLGTTALARSGSVAEADIFITDNAAPAAALKRFSRFKAKIITVNAVSLS